MCRQRKDFSGYFLNIFLLQRHYVFYFGNVNERGIKIILDLTREIVQMLYFATNIGYVLRYVFKLFSLSVFPQYKR